MTAWVEKWYAECFYTKTNIYGKSVSAGYPWKVGQPFRDPTDGVAPTQTELDLREEFLLTFPELSTYLQTAFPLEFTGATILLQQQSKDVVGHTDSDYIWAPRCYLWNDYQEEALWFRVPVDPNEEVKYNTLIKDNDYSNYSDPIYAKFPDHQYQPFAFKSSKSIHGVNGCFKEGASRCTIIIRGRFIIDKWNKLLHDSYIKYHNYAIIR
jgi:hypothetical protein